MAVWLPVQCLHFRSTEVVKNSKSAESKQRYRCQNSDCPYRTFILNPSYPGRTKQVKQQIVEMTLNGSGVRDTAQVLHVSSTTVIQELKKLAHLNPVNQKLLQWLKPESVEVDVVGVEEPAEASVEHSELDEMWSYVGKKSNPW